MVKFLLVGLGVLVGFFNPRNYRPVTCGGRIRGLKAIRLGLLRQPRKAQAYLNALHNGVEFHSRGVINREGVFLFYF
jgi:hypothetical protein